MTIQDIQITIGKAASALRFKANEPDFPLTPPAKEELLNIVASLNEIETMIVQNSLRLTV